MRRCDLAAPTEAPLAFDEVLVNAMLLDAPLLLAHHNDYGGWARTKLQMACAESCNVWGGSYPSAADSTFIRAGFLKPEL